MAKLLKHRRLADADTFPGFRPLERVEGISGDPGARLIKLVRRGKNGLRGMRDRASHLLRPSTTPCIRSDSRCTSVGGAAAPRSKTSAEELNLDWHTVKRLEMDYMREQIRRVGTPGPKVIGIDEISIRKGHVWSKCHGWPH
jgi:hypothetical protein